MTITPTATTGFYAEGSPLVGDDRPLSRAKPTTARIPNVLVPDPVAAVFERLHSYRIERRTLTEQPSTPSTARRAAALSLLADDAMTELLAAVADHKASWSEALAAHVVTTGDTYAAAVADLDAARTAVSEAGQVLAWLDATTNPPLRRFALHPPGQLDGQPWRAVIGTLQGEISDSQDPGSTDGPVDRPVFSTSLRDSVASFPTLDMPAELVAPHEEHQQLLDQHHALGIERRKIEDGRKTAAALDRRELADSIAAGTKDPGDRHVSKLDDQVAEIDRQRAALTTDIRNTYATLQRLLREHRDTWRATVATRHHAAVEIYTAAVAALPAARHAIHNATAAAAWLDATTPTDLGSWTQQDQPAVNGQPFDVLLDHLQRDVATQRQLSAAPTGPDAA